ncbi:hypothetical protein GIW70_19965 [Pseudomonas syringae]|nr:hypothetical protein [Pseudomonas syringae]MCF5070464.1 hypothetical protein [Pseudomonas syringae]
MKRVLTAVGILVLASFACANERTDASISGGSVYIRSDFGINRYLIRKMDLGKKTKEGNQVVNFAGARIVSSDGDVPFNRGYAVSDERDDIAPLRFNGTFIGANHGALFGVSLDAPNHGLSRKDVGTTMKDAEGTTFAVVEVNGPNSLTVLSEPQSSGRAWDFKLAVAGSLKATSGKRKVLFTEQKVSQIYPSVRRVSVNVNSDKRLVEGAGFEPVSKLEIVEVYELLNPLRFLPGKRKGVSRSEAKVTVRYKFSGNTTEVNTRVVALDKLHSFAMSGVQAGPLNYSSSALMQKIDGSTDYADWTDITAANGIQRIPVDGSVSMSQKVARDTLRFGLTIGVNQAKINGKAVGESGLVELSAAKKQYPVALEPGAGGFSGTLKPGDVAEVSAYRRYWPAIEAKPVPPQGTAQR